MSERQQSKGLSSLVIILFVVIITTHFWVLLLKIEDAPKSEARAPSPFPKIVNTSSFYAFSENFEKYYTDSFPLRYWSIHLNHRIRHTVLNENFFPDVIIGAESWLFLNWNENTDICQKSVLWEQEDLERSVEKLNSTHNYLKNQDVELFISIIPVKCSVYQEFSEYRLPIIGPQSSTEQFINYVKSNSDINIIDLSKVLIPAKENHLVFSVTDTHWTPIGAYLGYQQVMLSLFPEYKVQDLVQWDYSQDIRKEQRKTDLGNFISLPLFSEETIIVPDMPYLQPASTENHQNIYHGLDPDNNKTIVVFHDSFLDIDPIRPFLAEHFQKSIFIDMRWNNLWSHDTRLESTVEKWQPDIILVLIVERNIIWQMK